jgi:hypothetical protein
MPLPLLFRAEFWSTAWVALRRFPRDRRARRFILVWSGLVAYTVVYLRVFLAPLFAAGTHADFKAAIAPLLLAAVMLTCALAARAFYRSNERRNHIPSLLGDPNPKLNSESSEHPATAHELWRSTCLLAALLQRAGSESAIHTTTIAPGKEIATRRWQRDRLLTLGLWHDLPAEIRDLLLLPDGHWTEPQRDSVNALHEYLPGLRWALGLNGTLQPLSRLPTYRGETILATLDTPHPPTLRLAPTWELRTARDESYAYFDRCWLEAVARRIIGLHLEAHVLNEASRLKAEIDQHNSASTDLLVGARTISELDDITLMRMVVTSHRRWDLLDLLTKVASRDRPASAVETLLFSNLNPAQDDAVEAAEPEAESATA